MKPFEPVDDQERLRVVTWIAHQDRLIAAGPLPDRALDELLHAWESGALWDDGANRRLKLTPGQRGVVRELARRAVVARGGAYAVTTQPRPFHSCKLLVLADERGIRVTLPGGVPS